MTWQPSAEHFNPRSREGSDRGAPLTRRTRWHFNPRSREGSDCCMSPTFQRSKISIHAPAKGATQMAVPFLYRQRHFNPRSREGSDRTSCQTHGARSQISIHAPAKGATGGKWYFPDLDDISIHAPAKGATHNGARCGFDDDDFNPRSREGSDHSSFNSFNRSGVSIHAPAKGATTPLSSHLTGQAFQSTLPRRERLWHTGICRYDRVSIHAPAKGATPSVASTPATKGGFNPRSREGSDARCAAVRHGRSRFNPRSREGSDLWISASFRLQSTFQSTLPRRERRSACTQSAGR